MAIADRRLRDRAARRRLITATARAVAEREGWDAVTTRRLSTEIEYSQPVLYKHFASMDDIVDAVALEGFGELAETLSTARRDAERPDEVLRRVAHAYSSFAAENPALYDAMFTRPTRLRFGADAPAELSAGFAELREAVANVAGGRNVDTLTEVLWAALHGLTTLGRNDRLRPGYDTERIELLVAEFHDASSPKPTHTRVVPDNDTRDSSFPPSRPHTGRP
jgi:AcrR family transcriptional regulator